MARTTKIVPSRVVRAAVLAAGVAGIPIGLAVLAAQPSAAEPSQGRAHLAMMHEMGKGGPMGGRPGMPGMGADKPGGGSMAAPKDGTRGPMGGMGGMGMGGGGMGMMGGMRMMGEAPGAGSGMAMPSALPGFPGASHLYHVGATDFFLEHADQLGMSVEQKAALNGIKQRALTEQSAAQRKVDEAEQALWVLTAAEQPDAAAIEAKLREIEKLKSEQRLTFIRAVGEAGKALSAEQRKMVLGMVPMPSAAAPMK